MRRKAALLLFAVHVGAAPSISPTTIDEGGLSGIRGTATLTITGATFVAGGSGAANVRTALQSATGVYTALCAGTCGSALVPNGWGCRFIAASGFNPARVECTISQETFDVHAAATYTLGAWTDDAGTSWTGPSFNVRSSKGSAVVMTSVNNSGADVFNFPQTQVVSAGGSSVTTPAVILTEEDIRFGGEKIFVGLVGETWNDATTKAEVVSWLNQVVFAAATSTNANGFDARKGELMPSDVVIDFVSAWHPLGYNDTLIATLQRPGSLYDINTHEVITITVSDDAVSSVPPSGGKPSATLQFEIWPVPGTVNFTAGVAPTFTEDQIRAGTASFQMTITGDKWNSGLQWQVVRSSMVSNVLATDQPSGWNARRTALLPGPSAVVTANGDSTLTITISADPSFDVSLTETVCIEFPGCSNYAGIRVLPAGTSCTPTFVTASQLAPASDLCFTVEPSQGGMTLSPSFMYTECDVRTGFSVTLTLLQEQWNTGTERATRYEVWSRLHSDKTTAQEPSGWNVHMYPNRPAISSIVEGPASAPTQGDPPGVTILSPAEIILQIGPMPSYETDSNETIDFDFIMQSVPSTVFASGLAPQDYNTTLVIAPGPCHTLSAVTDCFAGSCATGQCTCLEFSESDVRGGYAKFTLTLSDGEQWSTQGTLESARWGIGMTSTDAFRGYVQSGPTGRSVDRVGGGAAGIGLSSPWGFISRFNLTGTGIVRMQRIGDRSMLMWLDDPAYDIPVDEVVDLYFPPEFFQSGVPLGQALRFTVRAETPVLSIAPSPAVVWECDIRGPAYRNDGLGYRIVGTDLRCLGATTLTLSATMYDATACAQLCHETSDCEFFALGAGSCIYELGTPPCTTTVSAGYTLYELSPQPTISFTLTGDNWVMSGDDVKAALSPQTVPLVTDWDRLLSNGAGIMFPSNNTLLFEIARDATYTLMEGAYSVTFTATPSMVSCGCWPSPPSLGFTMKKCPALLVVEGLEDGITEAEIWEGTRNITLVLKGGDVWNETIPWDFISLFTPDSIPLGAWNKHSDCLFKTRPVRDFYSPERLDIPLGPCPAFDINTHIAGFTGVYAPDDNSSVLLSVAGYMTASGEPPTGGNMLGFLGPGLYGNAVMINITSSPGIVRATPEVPYFEGDVRGGLYVVNLTITTGESFANPSQLDVAALVTKYTRAMDVQPSGGGWDFLQSVLVYSAQIDTTTNRSLIVKLNANPLYNIDIPERLCITIPPELTASGLVPYGEDGSHCVNWTMIMPERACVRMEPATYTLTEESYRTGGVSFDLVLDTGERWVNSIGGGLQDLVLNMSVAHPTSNLQGWEDRKFTYGTNAFEIDATRTRLKVRLPADSAGNLVGDPLYDIIENERIEVVVPDTVIGSGMVPCTRDNLTLSFNVTVIPGAVKMQPTEFTEGDIRNSGGTVVVTIIGNTWADPWTQQRKEEVRANLLSVCHFPNQPWPDWAGTAWQPMGYPNLAYPCTGGPWTSGFVRWRDDVVEPLVNMSMLEWHEDELRIILNPVPSFDIPHDELVVINLPPTAVATGFFPDGWNQLFFIIRASTALLSNSPLGGATGAVSSGPGVIVPGIPEESLRDGTAPQVRVHLSYETWDITETAFLPGGFCGSSGDCTDMTNPQGFNALRGALMPIASITYEGASGLVCPPNCPAVAAVVTFQATPTFDICSGAPEEVIVTVPTRTCASDPIESPTPVGIGAPNVLGFNITDLTPPTDVFQIKVHQNLVSSGNTITEDMIRNGGIQVTLYVNDVSWDTTAFPFTSILRSSMRSSLPNVEILSHAGPLITELLPDGPRGDSWEVPGSEGGKMLIFNLSSPFYDIPGTYPRDCCTWDLPTGTTDMLICIDGYNCLTTGLEGTGCCKTHQGRAQCPPNMPVMCANKVCTFPVPGTGGAQTYTDFCCEVQASDCNTPSKGGTRQCLCDRSELIWFDVDPRLTVCRLSPPAGGKLLNVFIQGESWTVSAVDTDSNTPEGRGRSAYAGTVFPFNITGTELNTMNDTAALSPIPGCGDTALLEGRSFGLSPLAPAAPLPHRPGLTGVLWQPTIDIPGFYEICYRDLRDQGFTRIPALAPGVVVYNHVTVIGQVLSYQGSWGGGSANVTNPEAGADSRHTISMTGRGLCTGSALQTCDQVKLVARGDATDGFQSCNPSYPAIVSNDSTNLYWGPVPLQPAPGFPMRSPDITSDPWFPAQDASAQVELTVPGNASICYKSRWATHWQYVGVVEVTPRVIEWGACEPLDVNFDPGTREVLESDPPATPFTRDHQTCEVSYRAIAGRPQRLYVRGVGLTTTAKLAGSRVRYFEYSSLGVGMCGVGFAPPPPPPPPPGDASP
eukprot:Hpha_TRINITY_DN23125_c0_g1::TRINITY_DN23125_c0_g1_i1::g.29509::m.29509